MSLKLKTSLRSKVRPGEVDYRPHIKDGTLSLNLTPVLILSNSDIYVDQFSQLWQIFKGEKKDCHFRCNISKHRPHLTCLHCRYRLWVKGEIPNMIRIKSYAVYEWVDRPHYRLKNIIRKKLLCLVEMLGT